MISMPAKPSISRAPESIAVRSPCFNSVECKVGAPTARRMGVGTGKGITSEMLEQVRGKRASKASAFLLDKACCGLCRSSAIPTSLGPVSRHLRLLGRKLIQSSWYTIVELQ
jgi:hypothetical protein